jgi:hypothetical protein
VLLKNGFPEPFRQKNGVHQKNDLIIRHMKTSLPQTAIRNGKKFEKIHSTNRGTNIYARTIYPEKNPEYAVDEISGVLGSLGVFDGVDLR